MSTTIALPHAAETSDPIFEGAPQAMLVIDPAQDRVLDANPAACRLFGYDRDTLCSTSVTELHPAQRPALIVFSQAVMQKGRWWTRGLTPRHATGRELKVEYVGAPIFNKSGGTDGRLLLTATDLDELRRRNVDSEADYFVRGGIAEWQRVERFFRDIERENQLILSAAGEGIYGVNAEGKTTFVNPAAERMLGWSAEELVGQDIHSMVHHSHANGTHYPGHDCPIYGAFRDGQIHTVANEVFWRKDGSPFWVEYTSTPIRDHGAVVGAVVVFRDVSLKREADDKLRAALDEVESLRQKLELENAYLQEEIRAESNHRG
ncbi:MAG: PAS domain S-box protein, partial [Ferrovibrio sp.]